MITTIYLIRHSKPNRNIIKYENDLIKNELTPLSVEGEKIAKDLANFPFFQNIDVIYSSHYTRTIETVKYLAEKVNKQIIIEKDFGERIRKTNINNITPPDYEKRQFKDHLFKLEGGESFNEVIKRYNDAITKVLNNNKGKNILIASHSTAILMYLTKYCDYDIDKLEFTYKDKLLLNGKIETPEIFKLTFEDDELTDIINLRLEKLYK